MNKNDCLNLFLSLFHHEPNTYFSALFPDYLNVDTHSKHLSLIAYYVHFATLMPTTRSKTNAKFWVIRAADSECHQVAPSLPLSMPTDAPRDITQLAAALPADAPSHIPPIAM
jgi:hypothetical protein